ncbi:MAG: helix-turn-helix domain-containing protein [Elusimicrobiota bacterium]
MKKLSENNLIRDTVHIGEIVRHARREAKLTQSEAAALCKVGTRFLSELEHGKHRLQIGKVLQVLHAFGLTINLQGKDSFHV